MPVAAFGSAEFLQGIENCSAGSQPALTQPHPRSAPCGVERCLEFLFGEGDRLLGGLVLEGHRHEGR